MEIENKKLKVIDLFAGIGGFSLGLENAGGFETTAFVENDINAQNVLRKHWPTTPIFSDIKEFNRNSFEYADVIVGGFPCQPFSTASAGKRVAEDLWPEMRRVVSEYRPSIVIAENVTKEAIEIALEELINNTLEEYDHDGKYVLYANKKLDLTVY